MKNDGQLNFIKDNHGTIHINPSTERKPLQSKDLNLATRIDDEKAQQVMEFCFTEEITRSDLVRIAVDKFMERHPFETEIDMLVSMLKASHERGKKSVLQKFTDANER